ncbi:MAG: hypothetical protein R3C18_07240 [Planctomycetaceae bacterium]
MFRTVVLLCVTASTQLAFAASNKGEVRNSLHERYEEVHYIKELDHIEFLKLVGSLTAGPAGAAAYAENLVREIAARTGEKVGKDIATKLLSGEMSEFIAGGKPVYVGIATYNHWEEVKVPDGFKFQGIHSHPTWGIRRMPLPNTHEIYLAIGKRRTESQPSNWISGPAEWNGTQGMAAIGNNVYVIQAGHLHRVNPQNGSYQRLGGRVWEGTQGMVAHGGKLYVIQAGFLHRVNPEDGTWVVLGGCVWKGDVHMASLGDSLYVVENSRLHRVRPSDGKWTVLGNAVWQNAEGIAALGKRLFIVQAGRLHEIINLSTGEWIHRGTADWSETEGMAALGSHLYIVQNKHLHRVKPNGEFVLLGGPVWEGTQGMTGHDGRLYVSQIGVFHRVTADGAFSIPGL